MSVRRLPPLLLALVLGLLAAVVVACGDEEGDDRRLLAPTRAAAIQEELDKIATRVEDGDCTALAPAFERLNEAIAGLPRSTDRRLRRRLAQGAENLEQVAPDECGGNRPETTETVPETVPETTTVPPETETPTQTTPPQTQTTPPATEPTETLPGDGTGGEEAPEGFAPPGQAKKDGKGKG